MVVGGVVESEMCLGVEWGDFVFLYVQVKEPGADLQPRQQVLDQDRQQTVYIGGGEGSFAVRAMVSRERDHYGHRKNRISILLAQVLIMNEKEHVWVWVWVWETIVHSEIRTATALKLKMKKNCETIR
jgi:hypothetical protein